MLSVHHHKSFNFLTFCCFVFFVVISQHLAIGNYANLSSSSLRRVALADDARGIRSYYADAPRR
jgi:hypothetical protein